EDAVYYFAVLARFPNSSGNTKNHSVYAWGGVLKPVPKSKYQNLANFTSFGILRVGEKETLI
ncbi:MAG: hypothetical protein M3358_17505, partial [Actinomycetota bacterium]|nr:hypothetical protein [Actinomycetota bacterium]